MVLDFSNAAVANPAVAADGSLYSLKCINNSTINWFFYIYQRMNAQSDNNIYSLAWMVSPYKIGMQSFITFKWSGNANFIWFDTGILRAGIVPMMGGGMAASLPNNNATIFDIQNNTPGFSKTSAGQSSTEFWVQVGNNVPNDTFSTGIGMSNFATFVQQSSPNATQQFSTNTTTFWVGAIVSSIEVSQTLPQTTIPNSANVVFPPNVFKMTAILGEDNLWTISNSQ